MIPALLLGTIDSWRVRLIFYCQLYLSMFIVILPGSRLRRCWCFLRKPHWPQVLNYHFVGACVCDDSWFKQPHLAPRLTDWPLGPCEATHLLHIKPPMCRGWTSHHHGHWGKISNMATLSKSAMNHYLQTLQLSGFDNTTLRPFSGGYPILKWSKSHSTLDKPRWSGIYSTLDKPRWRVAAGLVECGIDIATHLN